MVFPYCFCKAVGSEASGTLNALCVRAVLVEYTSRGLKQAPSPWRECLESFEHNDLEVAIYIGDGWEKGYAGQASQVQPWINSVMSPKECLRQHPEHRQAMLNKKGKRVAL